MTTTIDIEYRARLAALQQDLAQTEGMTKKAAREYVRQWVDANKAAEKQAREATKRATQAREELVKQLPVLGRLRDGYGDVTSKIAAFGGAINPVTAAIAGMVTATTAAVAGIAAMTRESIAWVRDATTMADQTGLTVDQVAALRVAAERAAKPFPALQQAVRSMSERMTEAALKGGEAAFAFRRLGVDIGDAQRGVRPTAQVLTEIIASLGQMTDKTEKAALMQKIFGGSGADLADALGRAGVSLQDLTHDAERYGLTLDAETIDATTRWDEATGRLTLTLDGLRNRVGAPMIQIVSSLAEQITNIIDPTIRWRERLAQIIVTGARAALTFGAVGRTIVAFADAIGFDIGAKLDAFQRQIEENIKLAAILDGEWQDYGPTLDMVATTTTKVTRATQASTRAIVDQNKAIREANKLRPPDMAARRQEVDVNALSDAAARAKSLGNAVGSVADQSDQAVAAIVANAAAAGDAIAGLIAQQMGQEAARYREGSRLQREFLKRKFAAEKAAAIVSATIQGAQAALVSYVSAGGLVMGAVAAGFAAAFAATQIATIAAAKPPKFHRGGMAPDETPAVLRAGEAVLTPTAARQMGGADGIERINRGEAPMGGMAVVVQLGHEVLGAAIERNMQRPDGPVRRALRLGLPAGRRMAGGVV